MDMKQFFEALQPQTATQQAKLGDNANTVLELLHNAYYDHVCTEDTDEMNAAFTELQQAVSHCTHPEQDKVMTTACHLCRLYQQSGFADGIKLGFRLTQVLLE